MRRKRREIKSRYVPMVITPAMYGEIFAIAEADDVSVTAVVERAIEQFMTQNTTQATTVEPAIAA